MRRSIGVLVMALAGALTTPAVTAGPALQYSFTTSAFGTSCGSGGNLPCSQDYAAYRGSLDAMTLTLEPSALDTGEASLTVQQLGLYEPAAISNSGVAALSLALYPTPPTPIALDGAAYEAGAGFFYFSLVLQLLLESDLTGLIHINDGSSEIGFATDKSLLSWLIDPALLLPTSPVSQWTGFVRSDALGSDLLFFTGAWQAVHAVPEPGTAALLLLALLTLAMAGARHRHRRTGLA